MAKIRARVAPLMLALSVFSTDPAAAQDPITKPLSEPAPSRLPAPATVTARQRPDGRIEVQWSPVAGAARYQVSVAVPPAPIRIIQPDPVDTTWVDSDVRAGSYYYYVVAAYSSDGVLGLKRGAAPVTATTGMAAAVAQLAAPDRVVITWNPRALQPSQIGTVTIERVVTSGTGTASTSLPGVSLGAGQYSDALPLSGSAQVYYRVPTIGGPVMTSNTLQIGGTTPAGGGGGGGGTSSLGATSSAGSATFTVSPTVNVRVGAAITLSGAGGGRWVSMDETIATVDASGVVTARAAGTVQIVALGSDASASLRVTSFAVVVSP